MAEAATKDGANLSASLDCLLRKLLDGGAMGMRSAGKGGHGHFSACRRNISLHRNACHVSDTRLGTNIPILFFCGVVTRPDRLRWWQPGTACECIQKGSSNCCIQQR